MQNFSHLFQEKYIFKIGLNEGGTRKNVRSQQKTGHISEMER